MYDATTLADAVDSLADPYQHTEPITEWTANRNKRVRRAHTVRMPSLIEQLREAVMPSRAAEDQAAAAAKVPGSVPAARVDAIDTLVAIEQGAARWCLSLGVDLREDAARNLRALVGAATTHDQRDDWLPALVDEVRGWTVQARVVCDWQTPAFRPHVPCPVCEIRALRIRLSARSACCVECGAIWGPEQIVALAEYVRSRTSAWGTTGVA